MEFVLGAHAPTVNADLSTPLDEIPAFLAALFGWAAALWWAWRRSARAPLGLAGLLIAPLFNVPPYFPWEEVPFSYPP